ncbi:MAG: hypothetical protein ACXVBH_13665 [Flavisolibacter sp.]
MTKHLMMKTIHVSVPFPIVVKFCSDKTFFKDGIVVLATTA